jgi:acyl dehydratase
MIEKVKLLKDRETGEKFMGKSRMVTGTELDTFLDVTGMRGDAFLSDEVAKAMGLKARVYPGAMSLAVMFGLLGDVLEGAMFTGVNNMKLLAPVHPYDRLSAECEILGKKETSKGDRVFVTYLWTLKNQDDVVVAQGENT